MHIFYRAITLLTKITILVRIASTFRALSGGHQEAVAFGEFRRTASSECSDKVTCNSDPHIQETDKDVDIANRMWAERGTRSMWNGRREIWNQRVQEIRDNHIHPQISQLPYQPQSSHWHKKAITHHMHPTQLFPII